MKRLLGVLFLFALVLSAAAAAEQKNLIADPSFELTKDKDQNGLVFQKWGGWKYEGEAEFRVGQVAHSGKTSCLLFGGNLPKIRVRAIEQELEPGRYMVKAFIRGLDVGVGQWNMTTEFMFDGKYIQLKKSGTFGWTPLTYVADVTEKKKVEGPSFGLMAPGFFWIDDVSMAKVGTDVALTPEPVLGKEEAPIAPPADVVEGKAVRCPECGYKNMPEWGRCYACGTLLAAASSSKTSAGAAKVKVITSFEDGKSPFSPGTVVSEHATDGTKALKLDKGYTSMDANQDWTGYDYLKADLYTDADSPMELTVEIRDTKSTGYWERVNYVTIAPPGKSTLIVPTAIYVGEKSRPGRMLDKADITRLVFGIPDDAPAPLFIDNVRLEHDTSAEEAKFDGLWSFDLGKDTSPLMEGFTKVAPATLYTKGRGYGLKDAKVWRADDVLQPDPLYEDFICIESGGFAVDLPNGKYHVFVNMDNPSGYWGEYQRYRERTITANGVEVVKDAMDLQSFKAKYYRYWNVEDSPADNTFDKYQIPYYKEKEFDVDVKNGQLYLEFKGDAWAASVSAIIIYPAEKSAQGRKFLDYVVAKRRFYFDNYFKRILHKPSGGGDEPTQADKQKGFILFSRDCMEDVYYNDKPRKGEACTKLSGAAFPGQYEPVTFAVMPLQDLGKATVAVTDLVSGNDKIAASNVGVTYVSNRLSRVTMEGSVYTISPRLLMKGNSIAMPEGVTRWWWLTVRVPATAAAGLYKGAITFSAEKGGKVEIPLEFAVHRGTLDALDVPAGPWGYTIDLPWYDEPATLKWNDELAAKDLAKMREYGFTSFSGIPDMYYQGFKDGKPVFNYARADAQMKLARAAGFTMPVTNYTTFGGLNLYFEDTAAMKAAGFTDYSAFVKAVFSAIEKHADEANWLTVYWNLGDEPVGENLTRSAENARAYRKAFPSGPPFFAAATSVTTGMDGYEEHLALATSLHVADVNGHDEGAIDAMHKAGTDWAFYNGGNRWTYGVYMYKAVKQFGMKFRLSWHWNNVAGDPYYALDCREDDYAWCNTSPNGELIPAVHFERLRAGVDDYRMMLTAARLTKEKKGTPAAAKADDLIKTRLAAFKLGQREHDPLFGIGDWNDFRAKMAAAIDDLRK